jgi:hypothetical protein
MKTTSIAVITLLILSFTSEAQNVKLKSIYAKQRTFEIGGDIFFTSTSYKIEQATIYQTSSSATITIFSVTPMGILLLMG